MTRRRPTLMLMALLTVLAAGAQPSAVLSGTVVSESSGERLAGATVTGGGATVVTNADGYFTLKTDSMPPCVLVTHLGYRSRQLCSLTAQRQPLTVRLQPVTVQLGEVLVVPDSPRHLVMEAIGRIPSNYSQQPEMHSCFYRETAMKRQRYICVAEGVTDMYKSPYRHGQGRDRVAIRKGRRLLSPRQNDTLSVKVLGGPMGPVQLDVVKNGDLLLSAEELDCYDLRMLPSASIADRPQYVVAIAPRRVMEWPLYIGKLYIDQETLAFTRADLSLDMSDRDKATRVMLIRKPAGVRFRPKELSLLIDYKMDADGLTRMSYVRTTFRFNCDWRRRLFATAFTAVCEMVVTGSHAGADVKPIRGRDSFDQRDAFFDKVEFFRDSTFWRDYNIIEPSESLDQAIRRIIRK